MTHRPFALISALLLTVGGVMPSYAADEATPPAAVARQQAFKKMLRTFEPMGVTLRGFTPYNQAQFLRQAELLQQLSHEPWLHFTAGTTGGKSRAKPEIWSKPAEFKTEQQRFLTAVDALTQSAKGDDLKDLRAKYGAISESCKHCHDTYRLPKT